MSILRIPYIFACLAIAAAVSGCKENIPSTELVKDFTFQTVNSYELYKESFKIDSWEKTNGWKDNENYIVTVSVKLKSKVAYIDLLSKCVVATEPSLKGSWSESSGVKVLAMESNMSNVGSEFIAYWNSVGTKEPWPAEFQKVSDRASKEDWDTLLKACDSYILNNYENIIDRTLSKETQRTTSYQLKFKNTEKGWIGFTS